MREVLKRGTFFEVLAKETICVFDGTFLPRMVWFGEEVVGAKSSRDISVAVELASVVKGDGFQDASERLQSTDDGGTDLVSFERRHQRGPNEARRAIYHGDYAAGAASADNRVDFNVTDPLTEVHFGRAFVNVSPVGDKTAIIVRVGSFLFLPSPVWEI